MKVIVGLGNPGPRYSGTRHNIGFAVVDYLAASPSVSGFRTRFQAQVAEMKEGDEQVMLVKPETFMNLSGQAVREVLDFYKLGLKDFLVVCDDIALPVGKLRVRARGSDGGQKGLRSIEEQLGTNEYARLRIGIGPPGEHQDAATYVLGRFPSGEREAIENAIAAAAQGALFWIRNDIDACMNRVNAGSEKQKKSDPPTAGPRRPERAPDENRNQ